MVSSLSERAAQKGLELTLERRMCMSIDCNVYCVRIEMGNYCKFFWLIFQYLSYLKTKQPPNLVISTSLITEPHSFSSENAYVETCVVKFFFLKALTHQPDYRSSDCLESSVTWVCSVCAVRSAAVKAVGDLFKPSVVFSADCTRWIGHDQIGHDQIGHDQIGPIAFSCQTVNRLMERDGDFSSVTPCPDWMQAPDCHVTSDALCPHWSR